MHYAVRAREARLAGAELMRQDAALEAKLSRADDDLRHAQEERSKQARILMVVREKSVARPSTASAKTGPKPDISERFEKEPAFQSALIAARRSLLAVRYGPLFAALKLPPEKIEKFVAIAIRREEQMMDINAVAKSKGFAREDPTIMQARGNIEQTTNSDLQELLGDADYSQYQDYHRSAGLRDILSGIAGGAVTVLREPLTAAQSEQLLQIMANGSESFRRGSTAGDLDWDSIDVQARQILSPAQFNYIRTLEPPLPVGGRYQSELYRLADSAMHQSPIAPKATP